jgi:flagellar motor protein MotB
MRDDPLTFDQATVRGADSNSLLRLYDLSRELFNNAQSQQERARADKAVRRIAKELGKRNVPL